MNFPKFPFLFLILGALFFILLTSGCTGPVERNATEQPTHMVDTFPVTSIVSVTTETIPVPSVQILVPSPTTPAVTTTESVVIEQARQAVRKFSNDPDNDLIFTGITHQSYGDFYEFKTSNSSYHVNSITGNVQSALWYENGTRNQIEIIDQDQGYVIAEAFAKEKYPGFWTVSDKREIKKISSKVIDAGSYREFDYGWQEIFPNPDKNTSSHAESIGQNSISVAVSPYTGHILSYLAWNKPLDPTLSLRPFLTGEQAWKYAEAYFQSTELSNIQPEEKDLKKLQIIDDAQNKQHLTYAFSAEQKDYHGLTYGGVVWIDAHDGSIISHVSFV